MKKWVLPHWLIVCGFLVVSGIAVLTYASNFGALDLSSKPEDWAHFGTYLSGTVGVAAVIATLAALVVTLRHQQRLIDQQEELIKQQENQISQQDSHQKKLEAYNKAEKFFPTLLDECRKDLDTAVTPRLELMGYTVIKSEFVNPYSDFISLFSKRLMPPNLVSAESAYISSVYGGFMAKWYRLAQFVGECVRDARELEDYFKSALEDEVMVLRCVLLYQKSFLGDEPCDLLRALSYPVSYKGMDCPEAIWETIGESKR